MTTADTAAFRLPQDVIPRRYEITLSPDLPARSFTGEETVTVEVQSPTRVVKLHALELEIHSVEARRNGAALMARVALDAETEQAHLEFERELEAGEWQLHIAFTGILNDKLRGFYRSTYRNPAGEERMIATTQFESTAARRAFPCWDEPAFKAVFAVTLIVDENLSAISAGAVVSNTVEPGTGKRRFVFADTMLLSTYLLSFIVGDLVPTDPVDVDGTPLRVWAPPGRENLTRFAVEAGAHALHFFNTYYGINYPGGKLDLLAIPDFAAGAMENMGAATFRETALLLDERTATQLEFQRIADVEAHEIAHMWFGDLVTMRWWNGLWLKEAFATFMALLSTDDYKPDWDVWTGFSTSKAGALLVDGLKSTRPIEFTVVSPRDAEAMYDVLTYEKGASVLRMLQQYLGPDTFREGIRAYLRKHQFSNTETTDLWDALEAASEEPVRRVADSWIFQPGYPLVSATRRGNTLALSQERFQYLRDETTGAGQHWEVPVAVAFSTAAGRRTEKVLLSGAETQVPVPAGAGAIVVNAGGDGVFRVRYSPELLDTLTSDVQGTLTAIERFNLVNDTWASVQAGYVPLAEYLDLTKRFADEMDPNVWSIIIASYGSVSRLPEGEARTQFETFVRERLATVYGRLGWEPEAGESGLTKQLRGQVLGAMGTLANDPQAQAQAREVYNRFTADPASVDADVAAAAIGIVAYTGGRAEWDQYWSRYKQARTPQEERRFMFSLASFRDRGLIEQTLAHTIDGEIRTQDGAFVIAQAIANRDQGEVGWQFMSDHWDELLRLFPDNSIIRMVDGVVTLSRPEFATRVNEFFATHQVPGAGKRLDQVLERLQIAVRFRQRESGNLARYLGG